jgi:hypothetical protein
MASPAIARDFQDDVVGGRLGVECPPAVVSAVLPDRIKQESIAVASVAQSL